MRNRNSAYSCRGMSRNEAEFADLPRNRWICVQLTIPKARLNGLVTLHRNGALKTQPDPHKHDGGSVLSGCCLALAGLCAFLLSHYGMAYRPMVGDCALNMHHGMAYATHSFINAQIINKTSICVLRWCARARCCNCDFMWHAGFGYKSASGRACACAV